MSMGTVGMPIYILFITDYTVLFEASFLCFSLYVFFKYSALLTLFFFFSDRISARVTLEHSRYLFQMKVVASLEKSAPKGLSLCMKEGK